MTQAVLTGRVCELASQQVAKTGHCWRCLNQHIQMCTCNQRHTTAQFDRIVLLLCWSLRASGPASRDCHVCDLLHAATRKLCNRLLLVFQTSAQSLKFEGLQRFKGLHCQSLKLAFSGAHMHINHVLWNRTCLITKVAYHKIGPDCLSDVKTRDLPHSQEHHHGKIDASRHQRYVCGLNVQNNDTQQPVPSASK